MKQWGRKRGPRRIPLLVGAGLLGSLLILIYVLYHVLVPFQTENPLWHEATVGEPVIDDWRYDGYNEEGYLVFYNAENRSAELPPNDKMLALDGKFVIIERSSPASVVYAEPIAAIPTKWLMVGVFVVMFAAAVLLIRLKLRRRRKRFASQLPGVAARVTTRLGSTAERKSQRFRTRKSSRNR